MKHSSHSRGLKRLVNCKLGISSASEDVDFVTERHTGLGHEGYPTVKGQCECPDTTVLV